MDRIADRTLQQNAFFSAATPYTINEILGFEHPTKVCILVAYLFVKKLFVFVVVQRKKK